MATERYDPRKAARQNQVPPAARGTGYWEEELEQNEKQKFVPSLRNVFLILHKDDRWEGVIAYDEFANQVEIGRASCRERV